MSCIISDKVSIVKNYFDGVEKSSINSSQIDSKPEIPKHCFTRGHPFVGLKQARIARLPILIPKRPREKSSTDGCPYFYLFYEIISISVCCCWQTIQDYNNW
jgi:hypothetical protein